MVVKAQIHAGGRGKGGGVKLAEDAEEAREIAGQDARHEAGHAPDRTGRPGSARLLVEEGCRSTKEFYLGIVLDRASGRPVFMASAAGGMDIEEVAAQDARKDLEGDDRSGGGLPPFQARKLAFGIGIPAAERRMPAVKFMQALYRRTKRWTRRCWRSIRFF